MLPHPWKFVLVALAIAAPAAASRGFAQQSDGSPGGLYAVPDADRSAGTAQESVSDRSAQSYLSSLDPQGEQSKRDLERAAAARDEVDSAKRLKYLAEKGGAGESLVSMPSLSERTWIAILAGVGLLVSLAVGGYVWWARTQLSKANAAVLLAIEREPAPRPDGAEKQDKAPKRRAA